MKVNHAYLHNNKITNLQAQMSYTNKCTNLLCFLIVLLDRKSLLFNFFKGGAQLLLFLHKLFFFILGLFDPLCQLLNYFLICFYLNFTAVDFSAVFINILRNRMEKKTSDHSRNLIHFSPFLEYIIILTD